MPRSLFAQTGDLVGDALKASATAKIAVQTLRRNVSVLLGPGGNIAVLTGPDGKLVVDAEIVTARPNVSAALASISSDPIKQLINTHWHFDHTGGNEWLHEAGASILAHENTRKHLLVDTRVEGWKHTFPAAPAGAIPSTVFRDDTHCTPMAQRLFSSTMRLRIRTPTSPSLRGGRHSSRATLFGTAITPLSTTRLAAASTGRSGRRRRTWQWSTDKTIVISGHGAVGARADLVLFRDVLVEIRDKVAALKKQGRPLPEVIAAKPGARYDAEWGNLFMTPSAFLALVYQGV